jgi:hypothetical protein
MVSMLQTCHPVEGGEEGGVRSRSAARQAFLGEGKRRPEVPVQGNNLKFNWEGVPPLRNRQGADCRKRSQASGGSVHLGVLVRLGAVKLAAVDHGGVAAIQAAGQAAQVAQVCLQGGKKAKEK